MHFWSEVRQWVQFLFVAAGGVVALLAYYQNLRQRRVENALKFIQLFRDGLDPEDMSHWNVLFKSTSEPSGARHGRYLQELTNDQRPLSDYFSEGAPDQHAIARMAESLNVVCHQVMDGSADARIVYYELGQLLESMHGWLRSVPGYFPNTLLSDSYPSIGAFLGRYHLAKKSWPCRVHAYVD